MTEFFYLIIINPVVQIIELCYIFVLRVFKNPAIALLGVSAAVSILTLPLYLRAEKWQQTEREIQKHLSPKIAKIKKVFRGDERFMILQVYYRQNNYHPAYALRASMGILIQIPFFIAAYTFIAHLETLKGVPFFFINDLAKPDSLFTFGGITVNVLPIVMTLVNCVSGAIYTRGLPARDKVQLYGMAFVFLVLLYNAQAALVLYWTGNNVFSLFKNILSKVKYKKVIIYVFSCFLVLLFDIYVLFFHQGYFIKRLIAFGGMTFVLLLPLFARFILSSKKKQAARSSPYGSKQDLPTLPGAHTAAAFESKEFILSFLSLFLLMGCVIPSALIASSVSEFSFLESYTTPLPFIAAAAIRCAGIFLFWPLGIYFLFPGKAQKLFTSLALYFLFFSIVNTFLFPGNYGFLTNTLLFSNPGATMANLRQALMNCAVLAALVPLIIIFRASRRGRLIFLQLLRIICVSFFIFSSFTVWRITKEYSELAARRDTGISTEEFSPVYQLSKTGKNVAVIMLDRAISGFIPYMFAEQPDIKEHWNGFTWFPNCAAFASWTLYGVPALAGGYEYTPLLMQENPKPLVEKNNEALLLLPLLFANNGYDSAVTDPAWANYGWTPDISIFNQYPKIHAQNISTGNAAYAHDWLREHPDIPVLSISKLLKERIIRFSFFKTAPVIVRLFIYDRGDWLSVTDREIKENNKEPTLQMIGKYAALDYLPRITSLNDNPSGGFAMIYNELTHDPVYLQAPLYIPSSSVTDRGKSPFADEAHYHVSMAAFRLLGNWFSWLRENNVYDNTRIIVVSDHGWNIDTGENHTLPGGSRVERYTSLLLVKDFNTNGELLINNDFMTQADVPLLALDGIIDNPINPFSQQPLKTEKQQGIFITTSDKFYPTKHGKYRFDIDENEWLFVRDNIFIPENWQAVQK